VFMDRVAPLTTVEALEQLVEDVLG
jgi:hypothetical protein